MADTRSHDTPVIPPFMGKAMLGLVLGALVVASYARLTDRPLSATPPVSEVAMSRDVILRADQSGRIIVLDPMGSAIAHLDEAKGGFIAGVARVLQRERTKAGTDLNGPVTVSRHENGRLSITDPSTGWSADLMGFGADNARAFARLLAQ
ncbi:photosynthetic complex assembly protein PuhC [Pseudaestuariivita atlantica]|uniref:Pullulanase n=1 Tax=Pseudaestuariivita atlantica TaxID=1317121 RepID=A0A0L1JPU6_9RHOB|nr:photosynthetic complex assembly protein PuhC [Pseudaestuariivita atlantica]KNG93756.1 pullulanase [Pseudaestuariivita atlantica]